MNYSTNNDYHYDEENIFFIIKYLLRSKSLVDAVLNVSDSKLKQSVVDRSTINLTTIVKLKTVLELYLPKDQFFMAKVQRILLLREYL